MSSAAADQTVDDVSCGDDGRFQQADGRIPAMDFDPRAGSALPKWRLKRVIEHVNTHIAGRISLADMAGAAGLSRMHFAAQFKIATGLRPHDFLLRCRIESAQELLAETDQRVIDIAMSVGFQTQAHFTTVFKRLVGDTPRHWRVAKERRADVVKPRYRPRMDLPPRDNVGLLAIGWERKTRATHPRYSVGL